MMMNPVDIIGMVVSKIDNTIVGDLIDNGNGTWSIMTCDMSYATINLSINGVQIIDIIEHGKDGEIVLGQSVSEPFILDAPKYYHGTAILVNAEIVFAENNPDPVQVFPMIYCPQTSRQADYPVFGPRKMVADCMVMFATKFISDWTSDQLNRYGVNPMIRLREKFKEAVRRDKRLFVDSYSTDFFNKLGDKVDGKGTLFSAFNDNCSGIIVEFSLVSYSDIKCECLPELPF